MKKILNSKIFIFLLGFVVASAIGVYAINANDITYHDSTLDTVLDDLYSKTHSNCISGSFTCTNCNTSEGQEILSFKPSSFVLYTLSNNTRRVWHYNENITGNQLQYYGGTSSTSAFFGVDALTKYIKNDKLWLSNFSNDFNNLTFTYYACY